MAFFFKDEERYLIPNWRNFQSTTRLGELGAFNMVKKSPTIKEDITDLIDGWKKNKTLGYASDLISGASVFSFDENIEVINAAKFILDNEGLISSVLKSVSTEIVYGKKSSDVNLEFTSVENLYQFHIEKTPVHDKIRFFKRLISSTPRNPINYVELARYYLYLGQNEQAKKTLYIALNLAPDNRFVLRSAVRFFVHNQELDIAHRVLKKSENTQIDPWLLATELAISLMRGKTSRLMKKGFSIVDSKKHKAFNISELSGSLATVEFINGNVKNSKKLFQTSLIAPNDNSVAQVEWMSNYYKDLKLYNINPSLDSFEALTYENIFNDNWSDADKNAQLWLLDQPFSSRPVISCSFIACAITEDYELAKKICKIGLLSNPNDTVILNNLAYASLKSGDIETAGSVLAHIKMLGYNSLDINGQIIATATLGLYLFRTGNLDMGRDYYNKAILKAKEIKQNELMVYAAIHLAMEEIFAKTSHVETIMAMVEYEYEKIAYDSGLGFMKHKLKSLYEQYKEFKN